ncbi:MAG: SpoIID/LytB domain-containing protein [Lachnospiraceae bacterium]|nr:SpoIID/LytB domain-containing protein [Lachnospiraceae bacterium]
MENTNEKKQPWQAAFCVRFGIRCMGNNDCGGVGIQETNYQKNASKKLLIVILWLILSAGIYWCSVSTRDNKEKGDLAENERTEQEETSYDNKEDTSLDREAISKEEALSDMIRVLIRTNDFIGIYHDQLRITCNNGFMAELGSSVTEYDAGEELVINKESFQDGAMIKLTGKGGGMLRVTNIKRNTEVSYRGAMECYRTNEGIVLINELTVEEYLYGVVPSEMPSSYPSEALKAQAISARTYTYFHKKSYAYPEWRANVDDSTSFQVYKNIEETAEARNAVDETRNKILTYDNEVIESFYYSTSSGYNGGARVWSEQENDSDNYLRETGEAVFAQNSKEGEAAYKQFIDNGNLSDAECTEAWYRWNYEKSFEGEACRKFLRHLYELSNQQPQNVRIRSQYLSKDKLLEEGAIKDIRVLTRQKSGLVTSLLIETANFRISVKTQHMIRQALGVSGDVVIKNDGSQYSMGDILPSAYFYIEKRENGDNLKSIAIHGAGLGHGCGMSQNGAKCLAAKGLTAYEILAYYYNGTIKSVEDLK